MERQKAVIASAIIAATVMSGAVAYAATSGITTGRGDNVGQLQPTAVQPSTITVVVDPATGAVSSPVPQAASAPVPADSATGSAVGRHESEHESEHEDD